MSDYQEEFWGARGVSRREERATRLGDNAIAILTPLLERDETLSILGAAWSLPWLQNATVALSGQRMFIVFWDRQGRSKRTVIADRNSVRARLVDGDGGVAVRIRGPWGTVELHGLGIAERAPGIASLFSMEQRPQKSPIDGTSSTTPGFAATPDLPIGARVSTPDRAIWRVHAAFASPL